MTQTATRRRPVAQYVAAEWTDPNGHEGTVRGDVVRQNGTSVYVRWNERNRVERIDRQDTSVRFLTAEDIAAEKPASHSAADSFDPDRYAIELAVDSVLRLGARDADQLFCESTFAAHTMDRIQFSDALVATGKVVRDGYVFRAAEATAPAPSTLRDRYNAAVAELAGRGITFVLDTSTRTADDAWCAAAEQHTRPAVASVEGASWGGTDELSYWENATRYPVRSLRVSYDYNDAPAAHAICDAFRRQGFLVEWDGQTRHTVYVCLTAKGSAEATRFAVTDAVRSGQHTPIAIARWLGLNYGDVQLRAQLFDLLHDGELVRRPGTGATRYDLAASR